MLDPIQIRLRNRNKKLRFLRFRFLFRVHNTGLMLVNVQEWIEALSFYHYLCYDKLITCQEVQAELTFQHRSVLSTSSDSSNVPAEFTLPEPQQQISGRRDSPVSNSPYPPAPTPSRRPPLSLVRGGPDGLVPG
jgi:hypothetical protein